MQREFETGILPVRIGIPFTLRELSGPWSWMAIRYYWLAYDELMAPYYRALVARDLDPVLYLMRPASEQLAGNVELALEQTELGFRVIGASEGSVILKVAGAWKALKGLAAWLPLYGKWLQEKGRIDIKAEVERSDALLHLAANFESFGIPPETAKQMALHRLYGAWPDFYAGASRALEQEVTVGAPKKTRKRLFVPEEMVRAVVPLVEQLKQIPPDEIQALSKPQKRLTSASSGRQKARR